MHVGSLEAVVDGGLNTRLNACSIVSEGIHAALRGIDFDDVDKLGLTTLELLLPVGALRFALFDQERLGIFTILEHLVDEVRLGDVRSESVLVPDPARRENFGDSSNDSVMSHTFFLINDYNQAISEFL